MRSHRCPRHRHGNAALIVGLSMMALCGFAALAVDIGTLEVARAQLQAGTDAAALAAAARIDGTSAGLFEAPDWGVAMAARNAVFREPIALRRANVNTGVWDPATYTFTLSSDPLLVNAVRVDSTRPGIPTPFAGLAFGLPVFSVSTSAIAVRPLEPARRVDCYLPVALPECTWDALLASGEQGDHHFYFGNDSDDNVGWAHPESPTPAAINATLQAFVDGTCGDGEDTISVGGPILLGNGVQVSTITYLEDALEASPLPWASDLFGPRPPRDPHSQYNPAQWPNVGVIEGPVAIFEYSGVCSDAKFTSEQQIVALAWGVVFDVYNGPGQHKGFQMYVDTDHDWTVPDGGGSGAGNVIAYGPSRLVGGVR